MISIQLRHLATHAILLPEIIVLRFFISSFQAGMRYNGLLVPQVGTNRSEAV